MPAAPCPRDWRGPCSRRRRCRGLPIRPVPPRARKRTYQTRRGEWFATASEPWLTGFRIEPVARLERILEGPALGPSRLGGAVNQQIAARIDDVPGAALRDEARNVLGTDGAEPALLPAVDVHH